jgi:chromosomal replication initiation ATPase DnaA
MTTQTELLTSFAQFIGFTATGETMVENYLKTLPPKPIDEGDIISVVSKEYKIDSDRMFVHAKPTPVCEPRQICMMLMFEVLDYSDTRVGLLFKKNRCTVLHAVKVIHNFIDTNKEFRLRFIGICHELGIPGQKINELVTAK